MIRRNHSTSFVGTSLVLPAFLAACMAGASASAQHQTASSELLAPIVVYSHLSPTGEFSDASTLNETLALRQIDDLVRLKQAGLRFDYDLMDATWFAAAGSYHTGPTLDWPKGPGAWIAKCRAAGIRPGLRVGGNVAAPTQAPPAWKDSLDQDGRSLSLFEGGFLADFISALQSWHDRGIRLFVLDSLNLAAATPATAAKLTRDEIVARNSAALRQALESFRKSNRDTVVLISSIPSNPESPAGPSAAGDAPGAEPAANPPAKLLEGFEFLSIGQPRPSVTPQADFRRSVDIESDARVRRFEQSGVLLQQIDSDGFTVGFGSGIHAFRGAFLLAMARGGWVNTVHSDLHLIQDNDLRWMARAQSLFLELQAQGRIHSFGAAPGSAQPYGFAAASPRGSVYVVINPGQAVASLALPPAPPLQSLQGAGRVQFRDAGFSPRLSGNSITLGPGQMAMVGFGAYAAPTYSFGTQEDVIIPNSIESVAAEFHFTAPRALEARFDPPMHGVLRVVVRPRSPGGLTLATPVIRDAHKSGALSDPFTFQATQGGRPIPVRIQNSGGSGADVPWLVGELDVNDLTPGVPVEVRFHSEKVDPSDLEGSAYAIEY